MSNVIAVKYLVSSNTNWDDDSAALAKLAALVGTHLKNGWCVKGPVVPVLRATRLPKYIQTMVKYGSADEVVIDVDLFTRVELPASEDEC